MSIDYINSTRGLLNNQEIKNTSHFNIIVRTRPQFQFHIVSTLKREYCYMQFERSLQAVWNQTLTFIMEHYCTIHKATHRLLTLPTPTFFCPTLLVVFFLLPDEKFFANQSEMSGRSFDWLNMFIEDCISLVKIK